MRAIALMEFGDASLFRLMDLPTPQIADDEVLIRVQVAGINPADWKDREGHTAAFFAIDFPYVIGFDAAGVIVETGSAVQGFAVGDRVFTTTNHGQGRPGSYAELVVASADRLAMIPEAMDATVAAALPVAALTAWQALFDTGKGGLKAGQKVLVNGGSGGVGSFAVPLAHWAGAAVACTCSSANIPYVSRRGADLAIDYQSGDVAASVLAWAPAGVDVIIDAVGTDSLPGALDLLKPGGVLVSIATLVADGDVAAQMQAAAREGKRKVLAIMDDVACGETLATIAGLISSGELPAPEIRSFAMEQVAQAHKLLETGRVRGKLVLAIEPV